jgi:small subunit ribosomal protein S6
LLEVNNLETGIKKLYEGMFLIDSAEAAKDWDGIIELINKMLVKADAEVVSVRKWDERPLAYTIRRCNRGTYILTYFRADGQKIRDIERDVQLSDRIMRALILKADHLTEEDIAKQVSGVRAEEVVSAPAASLLQSKTAGGAVAGPVSPRRAEAGQDEAGADNVSRVSGVGPEE